MPRKSRNLELMEMPGNHSQDLRTLQMKAAKELGGGLAITMRGLLEKGWLLMVDGKIITNPERTLL